MKRWILYTAGAVAALLLAPVEKTDVGELLPVELLYVYRSEGNVYVETDTGDWGIGRELEEALEDLKSTASGKVFLETADYLIVTGETAALLPELGEYLRPGAEVCIGIGADTQAAGFLKAHRPGVTLNDIRAGEERIPVLSRVEERYRLG